LDTQSIVSHVLAGTFVTCQNEKQFFMLPLWNALAESMSRPPVVVRGSESESELDFNYYFLITRTHAGPRPEAATQAVEDIAVGWSRVGEKIGLRDE
jgi:hypothetical protein